MNYCNNYAMLPDMKPITQLTIPPIPFRRFVFYVIQLMFQLEGKGRKIAIADNGSTLIEAFFKDETKRQEFCETVENAIDVIQSIAETPEIDEDILDFFGLEAFKSIDTFQSLIKM